MKKQKILNKEIASFDFQSGGEASSNLKNILRKLGVPAKTVRKTAIITYELEMNVVIHSCGGELTALISENELEIRVDDSGPGIEDLDKAFTAGYSTASEEIREMGFGAGMGLVNVKRYADQIDVKSSSENGTHVRVIIEL
ncbi:MAG: ATP-binding protein [Bacillota bacterium]